MKFGRRRWLQTALGCGAAFAFGGWSLWEQFGQRTDSQIVTRRSWALGSDVTMQVLGLPVPAAHAALDAAFAELETIEQVMSLYRPDSQLCRLNRDRSLANPHPYLVEVLEIAEQTSRLTDGAFDITVQPLWELFATCRRQRREPTLAELTMSRQSVDWTAVEMSHNQVRLRTPAQAVTLNGIAQGFATDRAIAVLQRHGVEHALINSGEVGSLGTKPDNQDWTVGIQHPRDADAFVALAELRGRSLATSGDYATTFSDDFRKNHIFDPRTGESPAELASVSIAAPTTVQADALSTAAMVLGSERTLALVESLPNVDVLLVSKNGRRKCSRGFPLQAESVMS